MVAIVECTTLAGGNPLYLEDRRARRYLSASGKPGWPPGRARYGGSRETDYRWR